MYVTSGPRYVKQRDKFSCGPVAIMNVLKWSGMEFSHEYLRDWAGGLCECGPPDGTAHKKFEKGLRQASKAYGRPFTVRKVMHPTLAQIDEHLREGGAIVLNYYWRREDEGTSNRHFMLVAGISDSGKSYLTVNDHREGPAARWDTRTLFKKSNLRFQKTDSSFKGWFISLKE